MRCSCRWQASGLCFCGFVQRAGRPQEDRATARVAPTFLVSFYLVYKMAIGITETIPHNAAHDVFMTLPPYLMFRLLATDRRSRSRRKGQGMTRISWPSCPFAVRFGHRFGFSDHLKARGPRPRRPFPPAWRFSARFGHTRRCAKLLQNRWHDTTYLSRGDDVTTPFPRPVQGEPKAASQHQ